jgi:hypothetical protein
MRILIDETIVKAALFDSNYYAEKLLQAIKEGVVESYISTASVLGLASRLPQMNTYAREFFETLTSYPNLKILDFDHLDLMNASKSYFNGKPLIYSINLQLVYKYNLNFYVTMIEKYNDEKVISPKSFVVSYL